MLMECLAAGRAISLPALSVGAAQLAARIVGAYATVREQFDTPIGRFEGIEEPLARIAGMTYLMTAARTLTAARSTPARSPRCSSAIVKAYLTEGMRHGRQRRDGHPRRRGDPARAAQHRWRAPAPRCRSASRSRAPTS